MDGKPVPAESIEERTASAVVEVVKRQREIGIDLVSDGEMGKPGFSSYIAERFDGFGGESIFVADDLAEFPAIIPRIFNQDTLAHVRLGNCIGPITLRDKEAVHRDIRNLKAALGDIDPSQAFLGAISPGQISLNYPNHYYNSFEDYIDAAAGALTHEYRSIVDAGFSLQIDAPDLASGAHCHPLGETMPDFMTSLAVRTDALNRALAGIPAERVRLHVCWGNYAGPHHLDIPLADIITEVLTVKAGTIYVEGAGPRHEHEWRVFRDVKLPAEKKVILGVIDTKTNYIEHPQTVADRLTRLCKIIGPERVIAGTDCGLATFINWGVDSGIAWRKLTSLVEGARLASAELAAA
jgi:5-methyltetrahydropteroyltriglutamate--homocysteine methyltransferase